MMTKRTLMGSVAGCGIAAGLAFTASAAEITVATVNNGDMIRMQELSSAWEEETGNTIEWVTLEENQLRQRVTQDVGMSGNSFDVVTVGNYEVPIWGQQGWLASLDDLPEDYNVDDLLPAVRKALSVEDTLYAVPFYGESAMVMYRTDLAEQAGIEMSDEPTWTEIREAAAAMQEAGDDVYGICLRGKPGWGENMALITAMANSYGARWFDMDWKAQFDSPEWQETLTDYLSLMNEYGPPGAAANGFNENLTLFQQGRCGMWIDATVAASFVTDPDESQVADNVGFARFPNKEGVDNHGNWLWVWTLGVPSSSDQQDVAKEFISWATSQDYTQLVAERQGWRAAPPGTRTSLYENAEYQEAAPFAEMTLNSIEAVNTDSPSVQETPYTGAQFVSIPEFQGIGTAVGQTFSAALAGQMDAEQALQSAQSATQRDIDRAGYGSN
ncbi:sugar ABC transporter substrate-binding protein [Palleronia sp. LCG004]|uniref:ABC transporter substrate-binding protein n=1 Tax=Palleronia sp. LCG004 TaxID=3079304 RepID=UPI0029437686|nr:sugar ABC transporter substrate-binding protein [Palleronia sp. LCG004]WOI57683.1 sugar ABC transporter substrate-binding protein [Palleronia sp. LCG004]